jgi:hypothetical protein
VLGGGAQFIEEIRAVPVARGRATLDARETAA